MRTKGWELDFHGLILRSANVVLDCKSLFAQFSGRSVQDATGRVFMSKVVKVDRRRVQDADRILGERIRARRNQKGMSQEELGHALGVSFQQIQKYEKGSNRVSTGRLIRACQALGCSISDLADGLVGSKAAKITPASQFAASKDGVAIIDAMSRIEDIGVRRQIIQLAERLAA